MTTTTTTPVVDRLLATLVEGRGGDSEAVFAPEAVLDATVPGWRFSTRGAATIARQFSGWFADAGEFEELRRQPTPDGEVVTYLLAWTERGMPMAAHHCHVLTIDPDTGKITRDEFFCGGRWDAALLARMAEESNAG